MISLGLLGSWTDGAFPLLLAGHLLLGLGAEGPVVGAEAASEEEEEGGECVSSLLG